MLSEFPDAPLHVQLVWEPVLATDVAAPTTGALALIDDARVAQYWDPEHVLSADLVRSVNESPARYGRDEPLPDGFIAWDVVAVFDRSARWDLDLPPPARYGGPVVHEIDAMREAITKILED